MRKFHEYQQAAWNTHHMGHSPGASDTGFSLAQGRRGHSPQDSFSSAPGGHPGQYQGYRGQSRAGSVASFPAGAASIHNFPTGPQPVFSPFNQPYQGGYGGSPAASVRGAGSDYGGVNRSTMPPPAMYAHQQAALRQSMMSFAPSNYGGPASMLGMPNSYSQQNFDPATARNSSYSLAAWAGQQAPPQDQNPFEDPSQVMPKPADPTNPTDDELVQALRVYLRTQDLLQVTKVSIMTMSNIAMSFKLLTSCINNKRTTREAMAAHFAQADLTKRKNFMNQSIDSILQGESQRPPLQHDRAHS